MQVGRYCHTSCQLASYIYVFCGHVSWSNRINAVEKLAIHADKNHKNSQAWELIPHENLVNLPKLSVPFSVSLNNEEIVILGGRPYSEQKVHIYDTRTDQCSSVAVTGSFFFYNFSRSNYPIAQCGHNKVVALVTGPLLEPYFIKFVKETRSIQS